MRIRTILPIMVMLVFGSLAGGGYLYYAQPREATFREAHADGATLARVRRGNTAFILAENQMVVKATARGHWIEGVPYMTIISAKSRWERRE